MRYSEWEQREMDIRSGEEMDRHAARMSTCTRCALRFAGDGPLCGICRLETRDKKWISIQ